MSDHTQVFGICENLCRVPLWAKSQLAVIPQEEYDEMETHEEQFYFTYDEEE